MQSAENEPVNKSLPDERGHFGVYGGRFVPETLMRPLDELNQAYEKYLKDPEFLAELDADLAHYVGRPGKRVAHRST
jgi:tryptophan synthase beta chain